MADGGAQQIAGLFAGDVDDDRRETAWLAIMVSASAALALRPPSDAISAPPSSLLREIQQPPPRDARGSKM